MDFYNNLPYARRNTMFQKIFNLIQKYDTIIIHRHNKPDGDAIGSQVGLKHILMANFPEKTVYAVGDDPRFFGFVQGSQMDTVADSAYENALAIILDCGASALISDSRYSLAPATARMDHHIFCEPLPRKKWWIPATKAAAPWSRILPGSAV